MKATSTDSRTGYAVLLETRWRGDQEHCYERFYCSSLEAAQDLEEVLLNYKLGWGISCVRTRIVRKRIPPDAMVVTPFWLDETDIDETYYILHDEDATIPYSEFKRGKDL